MMRISTSEIFRQATQALNEQEVSLNRKQLQIASGKSILQPSDDPIASARVMDLTSAGEATAQQSRNAGYAESRLSLAEDTLTTVTDNLQSVRELAIQAGNDSQTDETRANIAGEIEQRLQELVSLANSTDASGEYIFAGNKTETKPFVSSGGAVTFQGDDGQRFVRIGTQRQIAVNDPGSRVFMAAPAGNGVFTVDADAGNTGTGVIGTGSLVDRSAFVADDYTIEFTAPDQFEVRDGSGSVITTASYTSGDAINAVPGIEFTVSGDPQTGDQFTIEAAGSRDVFSTYQELIDTLKRPTQSSDADAAQLHTNINRALTGLDQALDHVVGARADIGGRLQVIDTQVAQNEDRELQFSSARSALADLDFTEAISELQQRLGAFKAAQTSFLRIQGLSLFNLIR